MPTRTAAEQAAYAAFQTVADRDGKDAAHALLIAVGDDLSLWPAEAPLTADDLAKLAHQLLVKGMTAVPCSQRAAFLRAMDDAVSAGRRITEAA